MNTESWLLALLGIGNLVLSLHRPHLLPGSGSWGWKKKGGLVLIVFLATFGAVYAAYTLSGSIPVRVVEPFQTIQGNATITLYPGNNSTASFRIENFIDQPLTVTVNVVASDSQIILWEAWPQTFTLGPLEVRIITIAFGAPDNLPAGDYRIDYTVVWVQT